MVVTGCFAETDRDVLERMHEVDMIFSNQGKNRIAEVLTGGGHGSCPGPASQGTEFLPLEIAKSDGRTRANVKIQDGCNHSCSYCKVVLARGRSRSRPPRDVLEEVRRLRDAGYREIILTGIQLGAYGLEKGNEGALAELIRDCAEFEGIERIRLSSVEPTDIRESLIGAFREVPKLCPHVHIPLQSGDDAVLKQMNRRYSPSLYIETISKLREAVPDFCLSLDVMVGFPGETEDAFLKSLEVLKNVRPLKSHIFPFSRRKGTRADRLKILPGTVVRERVRRISEWSGQISAEVREEFLGREFKVLAEHRDPGTGCWEGYAPNY
ncbi:MAG TPA: MiaB/RimO family radical SAM methylthiotransferase, partial [Candidatus Omnitrophota bacterium]|nr:MiaB/RimO family radical SAM methylthiotransferase [Candidatus Omnitrophota bacterium]